MLLLVNMCLCVYIYIYISIRPSVYLPELCVAPLRLVGSEAPPHDLAACDHWRARGGPTHMWCSGPAKSSFFCLFVCFCRFYFCLFVCLFVCLCCCSNRKQSSSRKSIINVTFTQNPTTEGFFYGITLQISTGTWRG